jgi:hypothetical protein
MPPPPPPAPKPSPKRGGVADIETALAWWPVQRLWWYILCGWMLLCDGPPGGGPQFLALRNDRLFCCYEWKVQCCDTRVYQEAFCWGKQMPSYANDDFILQGILVGIHAVVNS